MSDDRFPPVHPGPFLDPWPGGRGPRLTRPRAEGFPSQAGGGLLVPPGTPQTFTQQAIAQIGGTKVFPVSTASQKIVDAPSSYRNYLLIRNSSATDTAVIYIDFGADATLNSAVILAQNEVILFDAVVPQDDIYVIGNEAGQVSVMWSVIQLPL